LLEANVGSSLSIRIKASSSTTRIVIGSPRRRLGPLRQDHANHLILLPKTSSIYNFFFSINNNKSTATTILVFRRAKTSHGTVPAAALLHYGAQ